MCGIAGQVGRDPRTIQGRYAAYCAMQQTLARRGPDQRGMYICGAAALIHARLAVVDLENGLQPMQLDWQGETYVLVYNGELYNTPELRAALLHRGHRFAGHSDTEVLLHAFAEWGESCTAMCNGIFAFAVWQVNAGRLFLARDRCGVKPLFYTQAEDSLADLLVFSPLAAVFMAACILAIVIPLWLNHRKQGKGIALSSLRPSGACLRRYDFWVVLAITVGGAVLLRQSYAIEGISGYFPQAVYASIVGLGIFIMLMQIFSGTARKPETVRPGCYWSICLYLGLMGVGYLLIEPLGFYAATFLCIVAMTAYGTFWLSGRKADLRGIGSVLAYSLLLIAVEYGCFSLIMEVQTPTGLLF